jgi:hypothetical protein
VAAQKQPEIVGVLELDISLRNCTLIKDRIGFACYFLVWGAY